jgi:hypothetical protein
MSNTATQPRYPVLGLPKSTEYDQCGRYAWQTIIEGWKAFGRSTGETEHKGNVELNTPRTYT